MYAVVAVLAFACGIVVGVALKPSRQLFCPGCGSSLGCLACAKAREVSVGGTSTRLAPHP